ncbi:hypothetical protein K491DRAFT_718363 [Lophiostoma macrostomum CBS 122681]|uniref:Cytochrome b561 domain-containing protein n=1 Tax=Lophiostoma macrostomum CBS 122681 TaxID=1314788 RepID=A0A6A6T2J3_9PLEO|nr:hypothetical protein K491DRAFT_718363 [Lophiostoma macrostomum CBS 122681]
MNSRVALTLTLFVALTALASAHEDHDTTSPNTQINERPATVAQESHGPPPNVVRMYTAHAILACLAWAAIFPIGGIMIRMLSFPGLLWVHASLQIFGYCLYVAAVGLGIELSINPKFPRLGNKHVVIGLIISILFAMQSCTGYMHHLMFKRVMSRSTWSHIHLWTGRLCVTLGMINAGFGFQITHKGVNTWQVKTYTAFAVIVWVVYVVAIVVGEMRKRKAIAARKPETASSIGGSLDNGAARNSMIAKANPDIPAHMMEKEVSA